MLTDICFKIKALEFSVDDLHEQPIHRVSFLKEVCQGNPYNLPTKSARKHIHSLVVYLCQSDSRKLI